MKSSLGHLQVNIDVVNLNFYKDLMKFLGWNEIHIADDIAGYGGSNGASLWFLKKQKENSNDYDAHGVNHIGINTESQEDVDKVAEYLKGKSVELLFDTPKHRPEFAGENGVYYQVMFESPDKILFEVVYTKY